MGADVSQPSESYTQRPSHYVSAEINHIANQIAYRYANPNGNPIIYVKNILTAGKINQEIERANKRILNAFLDDLLAMMKLTDTYFANLFHKMYYTGSYYEKLRIADPNEFDINLILRLPFKPSERHFEYVEDVKSFMKYKLNTSTENNGVLWANVDLLNLLFEGEYLSPGKVRCWIQGVVDRALPLITLPDGVERVMPSASGPAKTMVLLTEDGYCIDIDLVPVIQFHFPEWPRGARKDVMNTFQVKFEDRFWFLVPKAFPAEERTVNPIDAKRLWRIHFPEIEKKIIHDRGHVKPVIKLLKALRDNEDWKILASYYLKTVVLWLVEKNPSPDYWKESNVYLRLIEALESLKDCVGQRCISYYFYPDFNLIQKIGWIQAENIHNRLERIIREIKVNPGKIEDYFVIGS